MRLGAGTYPSRLETESVQDVKICILSVCIHSAREMQGTDIVLAKQISVTSLKQS